MVNVQFIYYDGTTTSDQWDSTQQGKLPSAVEVMISLRRPTPKSSFALSAGTEERQPTVYDMLVDLPNSTVTAASRPGRVFGRQFRRQRRRRRPRFRRQRWQRPQLRAGGQAHRPKPTGPKPTRPVAPKPTKPVAPKPTKPVAPKPTKPTEPKPVRPVQPVAPKPTTPKPVKDVQPVKPITPIPSTKGGPAAAPPPAEASK